MAKISVLDNCTIDKIAAGEVVERPLSVVKELVENAIDAGADSITVEIKEGGISFIRVTDNGHGIDVKDVKTAFFRHATSKIHTIEDLLHVKSLGFRGEALSSIAAVSQVELITKTKNALVASRYVIEGGQEKSMEEVGAPTGTTMIVRNLFYNTPARRKFLKKPATESSYVGELLEYMALSRPDISFHYVNQNQLKLYTSGNGILKNVIYQIYGKDIAKNMIEIDKRTEYFRIAGYLGLPLISRGNRTFETYFVNHRYIKSTVITKAIEEGYQGFLMQHKFPFTILHLEMESKWLDVNVHPTKMELRFAKEIQMYERLSQEIKQSLLKKEQIPEIWEMGRKKEEKEEDVPEKICLPPILNVSNEASAHLKEKVLEEEDFSFDNKKNQSTPMQVEEPIPDYYVMTEEVSQEKIFQPSFLTKEARKSHRVIGQIFGTYWLLEYEQQLYIVDQHAAHEKVLYEQLVKEMKSKEITSQVISPPIIFSVTEKEKDALFQYSSYFQKLGFEIEPFGGNEYAVRAIPYNLYGLEGREFFMELLDQLVLEVGKEEWGYKVNEKLASMSCKAAVKGRHEISRQEVESLLEQLLSLENPYHCPHGRPVIIRMSKYELEKKFKRVL